MSINGNGDTLTITGAKLKVSGGVQVSGSIAYTDDATGFGGVTAQIDGETLNITAGKTSGVAKIERGTSANITGINHANVSNNTTIHIALKNTSSIKGNFVTIETFEDDDDVKVNYTDEYVIGPGETGMLTLRKVNGVLSLFIREMFSSTATDTDTKPFYIKDGTNYKYPLYKFSGGNLDITPVAINGVSYYQPSGGYTTKSRPPLGIPELIVSPSGNLAIGNNGDFSTINYDVWGVPASFDFGNIYQGTTKKASFLLENGEASGSFTESGASSGDAYSLYVERTDLSTSDTISTSSSGGWTGSLAFHHGTFTSSDYSSAYSTVGDAATAGFVYSDTSTTTTYTWGQVNSVTLTSDNTTYTWEPPNDISNAQLVLVAGGGGGGGTYESGGGGGGGYKSLTGQNISRGNNTIVVGNGGAGAIGNSVAAANGENSSFGSISTLGGGRGAGGAGNTSATIGGSGGGGNHPQLDGASGTAGQGNAGGDGLTVADNWAGGGGGGAGGVGGNASSSAAGTGGTGVTNDLLGSSIEFSAGGNGGRRPQGSNGVDATDHTGKGGAGGGNANGASSGGSGGSGIVIVKSDDASMGKTIPKVTGASFDSTNVTFTVQGASNITNIKYTINDDGTEQTTPVGTLAVAHNLSSSAAISVVAWAVDTNGNQLSAKKTVTGTIPSQPTLVNTISLTGGDWSTQNPVGQYDYINTNTNSTYYEYELSIASGNSNYYIAYNWTTKKWFDTNTGTTDNTFGTSATDTGTTSRETSENPSVVYVFSSQLEAQFNNPYYQT